jgi:hypothetical protein
MLADRPIDPLLTPVRELPIIAHLATRWDPTWHRPHRLLRALATQAPVLVIEEPVVLDAVRRERLEVGEVAPGVWRAQPRLPAYLREPERAATTVRAMLQAAMRPEGSLRGRFTGAVQWFSGAALADEFLDQFGETGIVVDGLAWEGVEGAEPTARERTLFQRADLVLASPAAARVLAERHASVLCVEGGLDPAHWAGTAPSDVPPELAALPRPIFGYLGAVDDRLDHALLQALRAQVPEGSIVLVGPPGRPPEDGAVAPALPPGVHWVGARDEPALPAWVRAFDVCVFPLVATHETMRTDAPLVLECLVAGRPVVSSVPPALPGALGSLVRVAAEPRAFATAAAAAVGATLDPVSTEGVTWADVTLRVRGALFEAIAARATPLGAIAEALIAGRGMPSGSSPDPR